MPHRLTIISPWKEGLWEECLGEIEHDFFHSAAYHRFSEEQGEGQAFLAVYREGKRRLVWPYLLRPIEGFDAEGLHDVTSAYGYPGPLALNGEEDTGFLHRGFQALKEILRSQHVVSVFTRLHPLLENHRLLPFEHRPTVCGQTVSVDLLGGSEEIVKGYGRTLRYHLNRARRSGLVVERDSGLRRLKSFTALYLQTMRRNQASPYYYFDSGYFENLFRRIGSHCHLLVALWEERVAAACVLVEWKGILHYHFGAADESCLHLTPLKVLLDEAARWGGRQGFRVFHLGGGRGAQRDGLFKFKAAFSRRAHDFYVWKSVIQESLYRELCARRDQERTAEANTRQSDFFPAYRRDRLDSRYATSVSRRF